jgi:hypothetical protein
VGKRATSNADRFRQICREVAKRLELKPSDDRVEHIATLTLGREMLSARMIEGDNIDPDKLLRFDEALRQHLPIVGHKIELLIYHPAETQTCPLCSHQFPIQRGVGETLEQQQAKARLELSREREAREAAKGANEREAPNPTPAKATEMTAGASAPFEARNDPPQAPPTAASGSPTRSEKPVNPSMAEFNRQCGHGRAPDGGEGRGNGRNGNGSVVWSGGVPNASSCIPSSYANVKRGTP